MELIFFCPKCQEETQLEEIMTNVTQTSIISVIDDSGAVDYVPTPSTEDGEIDRYQCFECGHVLEIEGCTVTNNEDLVTWIRLNCKEAQK